MKRSYSTCVFYCLIVLLFCAQLSTLPWVCASNLPKKNVNFISIRKQNKRHIVYAVSLFFRVMFRQVFAAKKKGWRKMLLLKIGKFIKKIEKANRDITWASWLLIARACWKVLGTKASKNIFQWLDKRSSGCEISSAQKKLFFLLSSQVMVDISLAKSEKWQENKASFWSVYKARLPKWVQKHVVRLQVEFLEDWLKGESRTMLKKQYALQNRYSFFLTQSGPVSKFSRQSYVSGLIKFAVKFLSTKDDFYWKTKYACMLAAHQQKLTQVEVRDELFPTVKKNAIRTGLRRVSPLHRQSNFLSMYKALRYNRWFVTSRRFKVIKTLSMYKRFIKKQYWAQFINNQFKFPLSEEFCKKFFFRKREMWKALFPWQRTARLAFRKRYYVQRTRRGLAISWILHRGLLAKKLLHKKNLTGVPPAMDVGYAKGPNVFYILPVDEDPNSLFFNVGGGETRQGLSFYASSTFFLQIFATIPVVQKFKRLSYSHILRQYSMLFFDLCQGTYSKKFFKSTPADSVLKRTRQYFWLTGKRKVGYMNRLKTILFLAGRLQIVSRYLELKKKSRVRSLKKMRSVKILFDRLFLWIYQQKKIRTFFSRRNTKVLGAGEVPWVQFLYKKSYKFLSL